jgi:hypothetical protein
VRAGGTVGNMEIDRQRDRECDKDSERENLGMGSASLSSTNMFFSNLH